EAAAGLDRLPNARGEAAWWRGKAMLDRGDPWEAAGLLADAALEFPADASVRLLHALALERCGDRDGAEQQLEDALVKCPGDRRMREELDRIRREGPASDRAFMEPDWPGDDGE